MIFVVIPTFRRTEHLLACLRCLAQQTVQARIIVCNSGSPDTTDEKVETEFPEAIVIKGHSDLWWTGSINLGLRYVIKNSKPGDFFVLLNDDTRFGPDYLSKLYDHAVRRPRSIIGSVCVDQNAPDVIVDGGVTINWYSAGLKNVNEGRLLDEFGPDHLEQVSVLSGRGTIFPVSVLAELGLLAEEQLPHYGADYDYTRRAARQGYELRVGYDAVVEGDLTSTGLHRRQSAVSLSGASAYFFGRKSTGNLIDRFRFSFLTAENPAVGMLFFLCSTARLVNRYLVHRE